MLGAPLMRPWTEKRTAGSGNKRNRSRSRSSHGKFIHSRGSRPLFRSAFSTGPYPLLPSISQSIRGSVYRDTFIQQLHARYGIVNNSLGGKKRKKEREKKKEQADYLDIEGGLIIKTSDTSITPLSLTALRGYQLADILHYCYPIMATFATILVSPL